ncbi:HU family DNA-binding protein [Deinococcus hopiensis]|uniref:DNA-binding protein HU-beta n=1 Tax=Deinococcus hopiensis KR-140 TaxID=695939 RepID=A0A1W1UX24_9DEIO|nr:HU family DNA-binding protein [Deinococcus hopiensis]SMB85559.1 DNA-binding protein HU-beta [Deinococcus hopiensis KR-140]
MTKKSPKNAVAAAPTASTGGKIGKAQLVETVADKTGLTKKQSEQAVSAMLDRVLTALQGGQNVTLPGLGTFSVKATGVRPGTSEKIQIPAGRKVSYKVASSLKESVNG